MRERLYKQYFSKFTWPIVLAALSCIGQVESNNNSCAMGDWDQDLCDYRAYGHLQIHEPALMDVNRWFGDSYRIEEMLDRKKAEDVYFKYMSILENSYILKHLGMPLESDMVLMWNQGSNSQFANREYYEKFKRCKEGL